LKSILEIFVQEAKKADSTGFAVSVFFSDDPTIQANSGSRNLVCCGIRGSYAAASLPSSSRIGPQQGAHRDASRFFPLFPIGFPVSSKEPFACAKGSFRNKGKDLSKAALKGATDQIYFGCCC
jgi:hypothetical protein